MMFITCYVLLVCIYLANSNKKLGVGVCSRDPLRCCPNYQLDDTFCKPCPIGTYGDKCSKECVYGFYGFGCVETCNCSRDQFCDAVKGCSYKTSDGFQTKEGITSVHVSIMVSSFAGAVLLVAIVLFILAKRQRETSRTSRGFYMGESRPVADTTSQSYMRVEENIYNEPDLASQDYIVPVDDSDQNKYNTSRHENISEKIEDIKKGNSAILSILMRKSKESDFNEMDMGYIDVTETGSGTG